MNIISFIQYVCLKTPRFFVKSKKLLQLVFVQGDQNVNTGENEGLRRSPASSHPLTEHIQQQK